MLVPYMLYQAERGVQIGNRTREEESGGGVAEDEAGLVQAEIKYKKPLFSTICTRNVPGMWFLVFKFALTVGSITTSHPSTQLEGQGMQQEIA
eukprot:3941084-Rhodomonas_salina.1